MEFHDKVIVGICDDVIVNNDDSWTEDDCKRFQKRFAAAFKNRLPPAFHFVSGLQAWKARIASNDASLQKAGLAALESLLLTAEHRSSAIERALRQLAQDLAYSLNNFRESHRTPIEFLWDPVAWANCSKQLTADKLGNDLIRILAQSTNIYA